MKKIYCIILPLYILLSVSAFADAEADRIAWIQNEHRHIRANANNYKKREFSFTGESAEGASGIGYISNEGEIKLIEVTYYGELGKSHYEFYYSKGDPIFVLVINFSYNTHIMMSEEIAKEWYEEDGIMPEVFDPSKTQKSEWRYYFENGEATRVIASDFLSKRPETRHILEASAKNYERLNKSLHRNSLPLAR